MAHLHRVASLLPLYLLCGPILGVSTQGFQPPAPIPNVGTATFINQIVSDWGLPKAPAWGSQSPTPILDAGTETFVNRILTEWGSPGGVAIAVVRKSGQGIGVDEKTLFAIGSNSKLFNVIAAGLLINNETLSPRVSWNSRIRSLIPSWALMDPLGHELSYRASDDTQTIISKAKFLRPSAEFREVWQYNNVMYMVLSHLPTALLPSKIPFARYVKANIFDPLGLGWTTYSFDAANATGNLADGMSRQRTPEEIRSDPLGPGIPRPLPYFSPTGGENGNAISGAGGIISNAIDMVSSVINAKWLQTLLLDGMNPTNNMSVIPPQVLGMVSTGITVQHGAAQFPELSPVVYGGGQGRSSYRGHEVIEHDGGAPGFHTKILRLPSDGLGVAILSNDDVYGSIFIQIIKGHILDRALGLTEIDWDASHHPGFYPPKPPRPANPPLPSVGPFTSLAGSYKNPGYQTIELCVVANLDSSRTGSSATQSCKDLTAEAPRTLPGAVDARIPSLLTRIDSVWASHLLLTHWSDNVFNISALQSVPTGNASEPFWMYVVDGRGVAEFARDSVGGRVGLGMSGIWDAGSRVPACSPAGSTVRERAEVWFDPEGV
ncbi:beta-lactamase/transpeptidase-like protein [Infundibulicybe gibba]|nr:beta-lactamase/transpeptidase-like protein [Infundibulicybe gibba]